MSRKSDFVAPTEPRETNSILFEWPLRGLKQMFDHSKTDQKSKVIKSTPFGGGRWTVLFYAQSGLEQFCSLYLNAEPLPNERVLPMLAGGSQTSESSSREISGRSNKSRSEGNGEDKWTRRGLFRFTFNIQTMDDKTNLGTKEAHDHAFSHKTSNWGWAKFAKRDHVYYKNADVMRDDGFLISVTITSSPEKPKIAKPMSHVVPPVLVHAMGSLLDDPEHSDVVFYLYSRRRANGKLQKSEVKKVYAIRKILAARSQYFRDMFESGFQEAEAEESSTDEETSQNQSRSIRGHHTPAHSQHSHHATARAEQIRRALDSDEEEELVEEQDDLDADDYEDQGAIMEDSDEDIDDIETSRTGSHHNHSFLREDNSPNEDEDVDSEEDDEEDEMGEEGKGGIHEDAVETDEEGESVATVDSAFVAPPQSAKVDSREASRRDSSTNFVDATSDQITEMVRSTSGTSGNEVAPFASGQASDVEPEIEHLAAVASSHRSVNTGSPSLVTTKAHSRAKRERAGTHESNNVRAKEALTVLKPPTTVHRRKRHTVDFAPLTSSFLPSDVASDDAPTSNTSTSLFASRRGRVPTGRFSEEMEKARKKRKAMIESHLDGFPGKPSPCSAKAMYRLADKLDIPDLKQRAQDHIAMSLTIQNIVWEVFSGFTAHYPDILKMETDFLLKHWPQVKRISAMKSIFLRHSAHPGLAQVWPHLLECLEYKRPELDDVDPEVVA